MDWTALLAELRNDLQDTADTPRYPDAQLYTYAKDAIRDYSQWLPRRRDLVPLTLAGGCYPLPVDFIQAIYVENPAGTFLEERQERPGVRYPEHIRPLSYTIESGSIYLNGTSSEPVILTYLATHAIPTTAIAPNPLIPGDTGTPAVEMSIPTSDVELIRLYVKSKVYEQTRGRQANLDRFKIKGTRDDNPLEPETDNLMRDYQIKLAQRIPGGSIRLYRRMK
jgi:hypothetical protein